MPYFNLECEQEKLLQRYNDKRTLIVYRSVRLEIRSLQESRLWPRLYTNILFIPLKYYAP